MEKETPQEPQQALVLRHEKMLIKMRIIADKLLSKVTENVDDDEKFFSALTQINEGTKTLQKLGSFIKGLLVVENVVQEKKQEYLEAQQSKNLNARDIEQILYFAKYYGLLDREKAQKRIPEIIRDFVEDKTYDPTEQELEMIRSMMTGPPKTSA